MQISDTPFGWSCYRTGAGSLSSLEASSVNRHSCPLRLTVTCTLRRASGLQHETAPPNLRRWNTHNTTRVTNEQTHKPSDTHETQSRPPTHPVLTVNPHPRKHPARSSSHPHARRLIGRKGPEVARARPTRRRHARPRCDHRSVPSSDSASHAKTPLVLVSHALNISP